MKTSALGAGLCLTLLAFIMPPAGYAPAKMLSIVYAPPLIITQGGTYTGNWQSLDPNVYAVTIHTTDPVTIQDCHLRGAGDLIGGLPPHSKVTLRRCQGEAVDARHPGYFARLVDVDSVDIEHNDIEATAGIQLSQHAVGDTTDQGFKVLANHVHNVFGSFVHLTMLADVAPVEIAWNEVFNDPGQSAAEDIISTDGSRGTATSPLLIHDNYLQGSYSLPPSAANNAGTCINVGGHPGTSLADEPGYVKVYDNQVVGCTNRSIAIMSGHDNEVYGNRVVTSGVLANRSLVGAASATGIGIWNTFHEPATRFFDNAVHDNVAGVSNGQGGGVNYALAACTLNARGQALCYNNAILPNPITPAMERAELTSWQQKVAQAALTIGLGTPSPTTVTPVASATSAADKSASSRISTAPNTSSFSLLLWVLCSMLVAFGTVTAFLWSRRTHGAYELLEVSAPGMKKDEAAATLPRLVNQKSEPEANRVGE